MVTLHKIIRIMYKNGLNLHINICVLVSHLHCDP